MDFEYIEIKRHEVDEGYKVTDMLKRKPTLFLHSCSAKSVDHHGNQATISRIGCSSTLGPASFSTGATNPTTT